MGRSSSPRVLMLEENNSYPHGSRVPREVEALAAAGYRVVVISPGHPGQPLREIIGGIRVFRYPAPRPGNGHLGYLWEYGYSMAATFLLSLTLFFREGFDVVHVANPPDTLVFLGAFYKLLGRRFVYDHHDLAPEMYNARFGGGCNGLVYRMLVLLERLSCRLADHVIATNQSYKAIEMQRDGVPEERITVVRNAPDLNRFRPVEPPAELRSEGKALLVYAGVIGFQDGVDYLVRALHHLVHDLGRTDFCCAIVGDGQALPGLKSMTRELSIADHVRFPGWVQQSEVARYLAAADICVAPEPSNPYCDRSTVVKMMEYMAMGKPIVAFDLPEHRFTAQAAALYVRPNDELEFARGLAQLMDNPELRLAMGSFARRRVEGELAWHHSARSLVNAYRTMLPRPRPWGADSAAQEGG